MRCSSSITVWIVAFHSFYSISIYLLCIVYIVGMQYIESMKIAYCVRNSEIIIVLVELYCCMYVILWHKSYFVCVSIVNFKQRHWSILSLWNCHGIFIYNWMCVFNGYWHRLHRISSYIQLQNILLYTQFMLPSVLCNSLSADRHHQLSSSSFSFFYYISFNFIAFLSFFANALFCTCFMRLEKQRWSRNWTNSINFCVQYNSIYYNM